MPSPHFGHNLCDDDGFGGPGVWMLVAAGAVTVEGSGAASESSGWTQLDWPQLLRRAVSRCRGCARKCVRAGARARRDGWRR